MHWPLIRTRFSRMSALMTMWCLVAGAACGQSPPPVVRIDLDQAIQMALAHNHA
jgi:hypothetical protein